MKTRRPKVSAVLTVPALIDLSVLSMRANIADRTGAANGMIRPMRALYRWGRDNELVTNDPCANVPLFESEDYEPWPDDLLAQALVDATSRFGRWHCSTTQPSD